MYCFFHARVSFKNDITRRGGEGDLKKVTMPERLQIGEGGILVSILPYKLENEGSIIELKIFLEVFRKVENNNSLLLATVLYINLEKIITLMSY